jgi:hypothetical protein
MTPDQAFQLASTLVMPQWLLMLVAPRWRVTQFLVTSYLIPVLLAVLYAAYLFSGGPIDFGAFGTLEGVKGLFQTGGDGVVLAGWVHYLAFDLMVGSVVLRDSHERGLAHWLVVVPLVFCFMLGPVGLLLYWLVRLLKTEAVA